MKKKLALLVVSLLCFSCSDGITEEGEDNTEWIKTRQCWELIYRYTCHNQSEEGNCISASGDDKFRDENGNIIPVFDENGNYSASFMTTEITIAQIEAQAEADGGCIYKKSACIQASRGEFDKLNKDNMKCGS